MKARSGTPLNGFGAQPDAGGKSQEPERPDLSILRKPIATSITGFREAVQAYENGTDEIRNLLAHECDIIYECKACRNIFRSLANFISHKRIYCRAKFSSAQHFHFRHDAAGVDRDVTTIVQAEQDYASAKTTVVGSAASKSSTKDLSSVVERLLRREHASRPVPEMATRNQIKMEPEPEPMEPSTNEEVVVLQFDKVQTNDCAVFQTIRHEAPDEEQTMSKDSIKVEVNEIHTMQSNRVTTMGLDGRVVPDVQADKLTCDICQMQFETEKTLRVHIKKHHVTSTFVYPCPSCTQTFIKPWAVMRHLSNDHKKSLRRIRQMRETILRRRTRISEIQVKGPSRELARLQLEERVRNEARERTTWPDNYSGIGGAPVMAPSNKSAKTQKLSSSKHSSLCSYCGKTFERRAALSTHLKSCPAKSSNPSAPASRVSSSTRSSEAEQKSAALLENDESNSNSTDSFMAMLNREKAIQAKIQEQELQLAAARAAVAETMDVKLECDRPTVVVKSEATTEQTKNKRKRTNVRKADVSAGCRVEDESDEMVFRWDNEFDAPDLAPVNGSEAVIKVENDVDQMIGDFYPINSKKVKLNVDDESGVTECTICERKFANLSNLRRHVAMFHYREKKFGCTMCQFRAYRKVDVLYHLSTIHKMSGDKEESSQFVRLIAVDKNKFSVEREKAVADAQLKMQQRLPVPVDMEELIDEILVKSELSEGAVRVKVEPGTNGHGTDGEIIIPLLKQEVLEPELQLHGLIASEASLQSSKAMFFEPLLTKTLQKPAEVQPIVAKRRGRPKGSTSLSSRKSFPIDSSPAPYPGLTAPPAKPNKQSKLIRHSSSNSSSSEETGLSAKRPVRNRIKAVNKDFVYDMSNLLKTDDNFAPFMSRSQKRKTIGSTPTTATSEEPTGATEEDSAAAPADLNPYKAPQQIKGAALAMAQISVYYNRACFNQPPENPAERPIVPAKIIALRRSIGSEWHVLKTDTPAPKPLNRRASNEQLCDTISRKKQAFDKLNSASRSAKLNQKHDFAPPTTNGHPNEPQAVLLIGDTDDSVPADCNGSFSFPVNFEPSHNPGTNSTIHVSAILPTMLSPSSPENSTPTKRISVIDRLAEIHQTKKLQESIRRLHISSGDENQ